MVGFRPPVARLLCRDAEASFLEDVGGNPG